MRFLSAFTAGDVLKPFKFRVESAGHCSPARKIRKAPGSDNLSSSRRGAENAFPRRFPLKTNSAGRVIALSGLGFENQVRQPFSTRSPRLFVSDSRLKGLLIPRNLIGRVCSSVSIRNGFKIFQSFLRALLSFLKLSAELFRNAQQQTIRLSDLFLRAICRFNPTVRGERNIDETLGGIALSALKILARSSGIIKTGVPLQSSRSILTQ